MQGQHGSNKLNLLEIGYQNLSLSRKRELFFLVSLTLQSLNKRGYMPLRITLDSIYIEDGYCFFEKIAPITDKLAESYSGAVFKSVYMLTDLFFCLYLPGYNFEAGLLSPEVLSQEFDQQSSYLPEDDRAYFRTILVDSYKNRKLPSRPYYNEFIQDLVSSRNTGGLGKVKYLSNNPSGINGSVGELIDSNENGDINFENISPNVIEFVDKSLGISSGNQEAFGNTFFFITVLTAICIVFGGIITYFLLYLG